MSVLPSKELKAMIEKLKPQQIEALKAIVEAMLWPEEKLTEEEAKMVEQGFTEIEQGEKVRWEDVRKELGL